MISSQWTSMGYQTRECSLLNFEHCWCCHCCVFTKSYTIAPWNRRLRCALVFAVWFTCRYVRLDPLLAGAAKTRGDKYKTIVKRRTLNPVWHQTFGALRRSSSRSWPRQAAQSPCRQCTHSLRRVCTVGCCAMVRRDRVEERDSTLCDLQRLGPASGTEQTESNMNQWAGAAPRVEAAFCSRVVSCRNLRLLDAAHRRCCSPFP